MKRNKTATAIAYYRVSTDKQGRSGLGLEAQQAAVTRYLGAAKLELAGAFTEIESGTAHKNRPQLKAAIEACKAKRAVLVIAKLDRLARKVHFISGLMESAVEFCACDMPEANRLTIHIMAAMAEHEAQMTSERTKAALAAAKVRGTKLGNPRWADSIYRATAARGVVVHQTPAPVMSMIRELRGQSKSYLAIAEQLNGLGVKTANGKPWYGSTVRAALLQKPVALAS